MYEYDRYIVSLSTCCSIMDVKVVSEVRRIQRKDLGGRESRRASVTSSIFGAPHRKHNIMLQLIPMLLASPQTKITGLYRFPVKGLSPDSLESVVIKPGEGTFADDRRFALLWRKNANKWNDKDPEWLHKENFLCTFTAPKLFSEYSTSYEIVGEENSNDYAGSSSSSLEGNVAATAQRLLTVKNRLTNSIVLGPIDLSTVEGREQLAHYFGRKSGKDLVCMSAASDTHSHQFGNTSSGVKVRDDTRTLHIVNAATVRELSKTLNTKINPTRFRPNVVFDGDLAPWQEFSWIGKTIKCGSMKLKVIQRTVRCEGVSIDPLDPGNVLDIPKLLAKNYPEHGPYLGVYAMVEAPGSMSIGDSVVLLE